MIGVDSSVLVDLFRSGNLAAKIDVAGDLCTSEIVVYELLFGIHASQNFSQKKLEEFEAVLDTFAYIFPIERKASTLAAEIGGKLSKAGQTVHDTDVLIAASILANGCNKLMTKNVRDFSRIDGLEVVTP